MFVTASGFYPFIALGRLKFTTFEADEDSLWTLSTHATPLPLVKPLATKTSMNSYLSHQRRGEMLPKGVVP